MVPHLFNRRYVSEYLRGCEGQIKARVLSMVDPDMKQSNDLLVPLLKSKSKKDKLVLSSPKKEDLGESSSQFQMGRTAKKINIKIGFKGDEQIFNYTPSEHSLLYPMGSIVGDEIHTVFEFLHGDSSENLASEIKNNTENIEKFVRNANQDIDGFNNHLQANIIQWLDLRRQQLNSYNEVFDSIDFDNSPSTSDSEMSFENPTERIQLEIEENGVHDPFLKEAIFQSITESLDRIGKSFEKVSPELRNMGEEQIRDFFLMCLQSSYGNLSLTGESFNKQGKTDILIKYLDEILYISEFKIWRDETTLSSGITQLLNNLTWRDSKCSYVVFSRIRNFSSVIANVKRIVSNHENCQILETDITESSFKFKFKSASDEEKIISLNLHLFDIH